MASSSISPEVIESVYESLENSLIVELACGMHRMAKTGQLAYSEIMIPSLPRAPPQTTNRRDKKDATETMDNFPSTRSEYESSNSGKGGVGKQPNHETNSAVLPETIKRRKISESSSGEDNQKIPNVNDIPATGRKSCSSDDIWGKTPPKEPKQACPNCERLMSVTRFAPHLDKCMGIGGSRNSSVGTLKRRGSR